MPKDMHKHNMLIASDHIFRKYPNDATGSISYLVVKPILPRSSKVFEVVPLGQVLELGKMLQNGDTSLNCVDDLGKSLLHVSFPSQPSYVFLKAAIKIRS